MDFLSIVWKIVDMLYKIASTAIAGDKICKTVCGRYKEHISNKNAKKRNSAPPAPTGKAEGTLSE